MVLLMCTRSLFRKRGKLLKTVLAALTLTCVVVIASLHLDNSLNNFATMALNENNLDFKTASLENFQSLTARPTVSMFVAPNTGSIFTADQREVKRPEKENLCNEPGVQIRPDFGIEESFIWQKIGDADAYAFSAHFNPRSSSVVISSMVVQLVQTFECKMWFRDSEQPQVVDTQTRVLPESHGTRYYSSLHTCHLKDVSKRPYAVTLSTSSCPTSPASLKVMYSNLEQSPSHPSASQSTGPHATNVNFTVCVTPLHFSFDDHRRLIEWIEVNRMFGAQRFVFYNYSTGVKATAVLRQYEAEGLVRILQWHLPMKVHVWPPANPSVEPEIYYFGQVAALNECLIRNRLSSRFIVFEDVDEIVVPRRRATWSQMIADMSHKHNGSGAKNGSDEVTYAAAYVVRSTFFRADWGNDTNITLPDAALTAEVRRLQPSTLVKLTREGEIFAPFIRSKYIVYSEAVLSVGIHVIEERDASIQADAPINVDISDALVHHYRPSMWENDPNNPPQHVYDPYMLQYASEIVARTAKRTALLQF